MTIQPNNIATLQTSRIIVRLHPVIDMTDEQFYEFWQLNQDLQIERTAT